MKVVTRKKETLYFPLYSNNENEKVVHYRDKDGKIISFKRMHSAEKFLQSKNEKIRGVVKSVTQNIFYSLS